ncbi:acyl-CoA synthetase FdrA [Paraburkholderia oxyphila]|uniref:acyl-CoA synthetase FdrA n=1 Tax=Paraburkholderia oxyphila TaxID=614212 RepID=UPI0005BC9B8E|nr:acyl-CoA synthetase FdrA [Paraburkholderia oxyphila]
MTIQSRIRKNLYKDSVALMLICQQVVARIGVKRTTLLMGTRGNKDILAQANLLQSELDAAQPNDIMAVVEDDDPTAIDAAFREIDALLEGEAVKSSSSGGETLQPRSIAMGVASAEGANLAQISVPGAYAGAEALKALRLGLNVFLFSDNVALDQEVALKQLAQRKGLLVMGPDCGTAILDGVPLGFANVVRRGRIGVVAASGTGLQEVTCQIDRQGEGISQAIGTGGRDVYEQVGGRTMRQGLERLANDPQTEVIVIVSKPPARPVADALITYAQTLGKPVVVLFLGARAQTSPSRAIHFVETLEEAANLAVALARAEAPAPQTGHAASHAGLPAFAPGQRYVRALYSGGTFCAEAQAIWRDAGVRTLSNTPLDPACALPNALESEGHCALDLGDDAFTVGRPHPMIDCGQRLERLAQEARDPSVAVIVLDFVLGYGSHPDPAGAHAPAIVDALRTARSEGRGLVVIGFVCGTEDDPQRRSAQQKTLEDAGVRVVGGSTQAARLAAEIVAMLPADEPVASCASTQ